MQNPLLPLSQMTVPPPMQGVQFDPTKLADIHLPESVSFWPLAPGWWILLGFVLILVALITYFIKRKPKIPAPTSKELKSQAMIELESIKEDYESQAQPHETIKKLSVFLRRYALSLYQRDNIASLTDEEWLALLDELISIKPDTTNTSHSDKGVFSNKFSTLLTQAPYQSTQKPIDNELLDDLLNTTDTLIKRSFKRFNTTKEKHVEDKYV